MATVHVYLNFLGNCEEVFNFYKSVFGGEFLYIGRYKEMPTSDDQCGLPTEFDEKIMHISYKINNETTLFGSDLVGDWAKNYQAGNNFSLSVNAESKAEADRIFEALAQDGQVMMPLSDTFWGAYFGSFVDKFGINWMVNFDYQPQ